MDFNDYDDINNTVDIDLSDFDDDCTVLDELPDTDRFVSLEDFLKRGDDNYRKWSLD